MKKLLFIFLFYANFQFCAQDAANTKLVLEEPAILQILQIELKPMNLAPEINLKKIARILRFYKITQDELAHMILILKKFAGPDHSRLISQDYLSSVINKKLDHQILINLMYMLAVNKRAVAIHEAAHAIACIYLLPQYHVLTEVTLFGNDSNGAFTQIISRLNSNDHIKELQFCESMIMMSLAGGVADQFFGLPTMAQWYSAVDWLVGRKRNDSTGLEALFLKRSIKDDMSMAWFYMNHIQKNILQRNDTITNEDYYNILHNYYEQTVEFVFNHKAEIEKLADVLVKKGTIFSEEIYKLLNMQVPLFDFEQ